MKGIGIVAVGIVVSACAPTAPLLTGSIAARSAAVQSDGGRPPFDYELSIGMADDSGAVRSSGSVTLEREVGRAYLGTALATEAMAAGFVAGWTMADAPDDGMYAQRVYVGRALVGGHVTVGVGRSWYARWYGRAVTVGRVTVEVPTGPVRVKVLAEQSTRRSAVEASLGGAFGEVAKIVPTVEYRYWDGGDGGQSAFKAKIGVEWRVE